MILTGKAKADFEIWLLKDGNEVINDGTIEYDLYYMCKYMIPQNMVFYKIIEWFDSVGYHIGIEPHIGGGADVYYAKIVYRMDNFIDTWLDVENTIYSPIELHFESRKEATKQAIIKANELYNGI